jgi:hypothetical protein
VEIPADHRLVIEVPPEVPAGRAKVTVSIFPRGKTAKMSRHMRAEWDCPWDKHE